ncbi:hypothetical protein ECFDA506_1904, partial [Escherichia coli FDA506]
MASSTSARFFQLL